MQQNDFCEKISFESIQDLFPEYFQPLDLQKIDSALAKLNKLLISYSSINEVLNNEQFTYEEVSSIALWKASIYYSECPTVVKGTEERVFLAILNRFTQHYLDLAGKR